MADTPALVLQVAAKAVIINEEGKVLVVRESPLETRSKVGQYQIVGGRIEPGETYEEALKREVREEVGLEIEPQYPIYIDEWRPVIKGTPHQIIAFFTVCKAKTTNVKLSDEHDDYQWVDPANYANVPIMTPDFKVIDRYAQWEAKPI